MTARELAKGIRRELDRQERYRRDHGQVSVEQVKVVRQAVNVLVEEIKADLPDVRLAEDGSRQRLAYGEKVYVQISYETSEIILLEGTRTGTKQQTFKLELKDDSWLWVSFFHKDIEDLADLLVRIYLENVAAEHNLSGSSPTP